VRARDNVLQPVIDDIYHHRNSRAFCVRHHQLLISGGARPAQVSESTSIQNTRHDSTPAARSISLSPLISRHRPLRARAHYPFRRKLARFSRIGDRQILGSTAARLCRSASTHVAVAQGKKEEQAVPNGKQRCEWS
jgi:hypothetical protein